MIQPMVYGQSAEYSNDNFSGYFDWSTNNKATEVLENIMATNDMTYGIPSGNQKNIRPKISVINFAESVSGNPYKGGVNHPNGKIYFFPLDSTAILEFEPVSQTVKKWGSLSTSTNKMVGGVVDTNGIMYSFPTVSYLQSVLEFNPYTKKIITSATTAIENSNGCILHPNGKIYGVPASGGVLEYNTITKTQSSFGGTVVGTAIYNGACIHPNGNIYCAPWSGASGDLALEINVYTKKVTKLQHTGSAISNNNAFNGLILAPNNLMYAVPHSSNRVLEINPYTKETRLVGPIITPNITQRYSGGCLGPDGYIYMMPYSGSSTSVLKFDWKTFLVEYLVVPGLTIGSAKCSGAILAQDGCIYGTPTSTTLSNAQIIKIDFGIGVKEGVYCREVNKY